MGHMREMIGFNPLPVPLFGFCCLIFDLLDLIALHDHQCIFLTRRQQSRKIDESVFYPVHIVIADMPCLRTNI